MPNFAAIMHNLLREGPTVLFRGAARRIDRIADSLAPEPRLSDEERAESQRDSALLAKNERFRNVLEGHRAFVVGNGPSLNLQDLDRLTGENLIVSNSFYHHPLAQSQQPVALCLADPKWFSDAQPAHQRDLNQMRQVLRATNFFVPTWAFESVANHSLLPTERTFYCRMEGGTHESSEFSYDLTRPIPGVWNVSHFQIMVALFMGCNPIYLVGMDHDWFSAGNRLSHFYDEDAGPSDSGQTSQRPQRDYDDLLLEVLRVWHGHRHLRVVAERNGHTILNATAGGLLDVYERAAFDSLF